MPRKKRLWKLGACHHVMLRGIMGRSIFEDKRDYVKFCLLLQKVSEHYAQKIHAFCLMYNHIHLILEPIQGTLKDGVHNIAFRYAQYFNMRHEHKGYLFQGRFRSILVQDGLYLKRLIRYIHLNPVEAAIVQRPEEYKWSSHNAYFGKTAYTWLDTDHVLSQFGNNRCDALNNFSEFIARNVEAKSDIEEIRKVGRIGVYGTEEFVRIYAPESFEKIKNPQTFVKLSIEEVVQHVCQCLDLSLEQLCSSGKSKAQVDGRSVLARSCQFIEGCSLGDVCRILGKHHGTVSRLASRAAQSPELTRIVEKLFDAHA